ncbi:MAG: phosphonate C-P lyase system protein PhnH [Desulfobacterales bacterium]|jgi:alpha-D-ribose 1-methylphosphonate 5-triphosphate synthase subunit PhnH
MKFEMDVHAKSPAFENSEMGSEQTFRAILKAMVQPGQLVKIKNKLYIAKLLNAASAAVCLTLLNAETPLWTDLSWDSSAIS